MNRLSFDFSMEEFDSNTEDTVGLWIEMMVDEKFQEAADLCDVFIEKYKVGFQERTLKIESDVYNDLLVVLVFVRGLFDYVQLCKLTSSGTWYNSNKDVSPHGSNYVTVVIALFLLRSCVEVRR